MYIAFAALTSKIFAPGEDLTDGQFVLAMDHNELRTTKTGFPSNYILQCEHQYYLPESYKLTED